MKRALVAALLVVAAVPLLYMVATMPPHGSPETPPYTHVSAYYLEHGPEEAGAENIVTDVILNYRGFDTNGEVTVIFTSLAAVFAVLLLGRGATGDAGSGTPAPPVSPIVQFTVQLLAPFIVIFSVYVILNGHVTPGGGFQGGAILGALAIVSTLALGRERAEALLPRRARPWLTIAAPLTFVAVGLAGLAIGGYYMYFPRSEELRWLAEAGLVAIEIGIGVGGAAIVASLYWTMEREG